MRYSEMDDSQISSLIENRWASSETLWQQIKEITKKNTNTYEGKMEWHKRARIPPTRPLISSNRVFTNQEAVINSLIANPPQPNVIPSRNGEAAKKVASALEKTLSLKYAKLNVKEILRMCLRDLFFSRLFVMKPYWNTKKNDVDVRRVDPTRVRFSKTAKNEEESEFAIEEIDTTVCKLLEQFPEKEKEILRAANTTIDRVYIDDPETCYKEAWIADELIVKFKREILYKGRNPYWDSDGLITTREEMETLDADDGVSQKEKLQNIKKATFSPDVTEGEATEEVSVQDARRSMKEEGQNFEAYLFNYFDHPRKPYIFGTILNNEDKPIGRTSFIEEAQSLQEVVDRLKYQIYLNTEVVNGITKVESSVMSKGEAQTMRYDAGGVLWGKGVVAGVVREFGSGLPAFVFEDLQDSRNEIDNIMAATSAFRGEREGQETKGGRLALIEQSFLRLNEMVQVIDYTMQELFGWWMQLIKVNYTERHLMKELGPDGALEVIEILQDDIENGIEVRVIPGKSLPEDRRFMFERAQGDVEKGFISPLDYLREAGYQNPKETALNAYEWAQNPAKVLGVEQAPPPAAPPMAGAPAEAEALQPQSVPVGEGPALPM